MFGTLFAALVDVCDRYELAHGEIYCAEARNSDTLVEDNANEQLIKEKKNILYKYHSNLPTLDKIMLVW